MFTSIHNKTRLRVRRPSIHSYNTHARDLQIRICIGDERSKRELLYFLVTPDFYVRRKHTHTIMIMLLVEEVKNAALGEVLDQHQVKAKEIIIFDRY